MIEYGDDLADQIMFLSTLWTFIIDNEGKWVHYITIQLLSTRVRTVSLHV